MYKERKVVYLRCDVCGQEFDQNSEDGVTSVRHNSFMNGWVTYHDYDICESCLYDILEKHLDAHIAS